MDQKWRGGCVDYDKTHPVNPWPCGNLSIGIDLGCVRFDQVCVPKQTQGSLVVCFYVYASVSVCPVLPSATLTG